MKKNLFTLSNAISALRMVLAVPVYTALRDGDTERAVIIMIAAFASDMLDGAVARKTNTVSEAGKIIDPVADKIFIASCVVALLLRRVLPLWYVAAIIGRDVLILIGSLLLRGKVGNIQPSNYVGKLTVTSISVALIMSLFVSGPILLAFMIVSIVLSAWSIVSYSLRLFKR